MMDLLTTGLALLFCGLLWWLLAPSHPGKNLPPGPRGLPLVGSLFAINWDHPQLTFMRWAERFGEVVRYRVGRENFVMLSSPRAMKEAFVTQGTVFSGRPVSPYLRIVFHGRGIVFIDGDRWRTNRRLVLRILRDFGFGRTLSEDIIVSEMELAGMGKPDRDLLLGYLALIPPAHRADVLKDRRAYDSADGLSSVVRGVETWREAHKIVVKLEEADSGSRALVAAVAVGWRW